jgi:NitT/TauT family transport system ATP-binding protein
MRLKFPFLSYNKGLKVSEETENRGGRLRFSCRRLALGFSTNEGRVEVLRDLNIGVEQGEFVCVVGPSGCGKTTLLRAIAGFLKPESGSIEHHRPDSSRGCLMVYQSDSLFPWMNVMDNACFGLEADGVSRADRERLALPLLRRFNLAGRERAWPHQISAGMRQRVAVIRSFLSSADLLLMDEPFATLDCHMRLNLQEDLLNLWEQNHKTVVFVTHDVDEAILLSDRVVALSALPGTVAAEFPVLFDRPREPGLTLSEEFLQLKREIYASLPFSAERAYAR